MCYHAEHLIRSITGFVLSCAYMMVGMTGFVALREGDDLLVLLSLGYEMRRLLVLKGALVQVTDVHDICAVEV